MPMVVPFLPAIGSAVGGLFSGSHSGGHSAKGLEDFFASHLKSDSATRDKLLGENEQALDFSKLPQTELYKTFLNNDRNSTSSSYDTAVTNARANAQSRGFGYTSPLEQTAETGIRGAEAGRLAGSKGRALLDTIQPTLQAAGIRAGEMPNFDPKGWAPSITGIQQGANAASSGLTSSLFGLAGQLLPKPKSTNGEDTDISTGGT